VGCNVGHHILPSRYMDCRETTRLGTVQHEVKAPLRRLPAVGDLDFDAILSTHLTIGMLLHRVPSGVCLEFICANATPTARTSASSSKSEFVSRPLGVSTDTTSLAMSSGNSSLQTAG